MTVTTLFWMIWCLLSFATHYTHRFSLTITNSRTNCTPKVKTCRCTLTVQAIKKKKDLALWGYGPRTFLMRNSTEWAMHAFMVDFNLFHLGIKVFHTNPRMGIRSHHTLALFIFCFCYMFPVHISTYIIDLRSQRLRRLLYLEKEHLWNSLYDRVWQGTGSVIIYSSL